MGRWRVIASRTNVLKVGAGIASNSTLSPWICNGPVAKCLIGQRRLFRMLHEPTFQVLAIMLAAILTGGIEELRAGRRFRGIVLTAGSLLVFAFLAIYWPEAKSAAHAVSAAVSSRWNNPRT